LERIDPILFGGISSTLFAVRVSVNAPGHYGSFIDERYDLAHSDRIARMELKFYQ
jgi:hypothetical protein